MTKEEYKQLSAKIIADNGVAEFNLSEPMNESARKLSELRKEYRLSCLAQARVRAKELGQQQAPSELKDIKAGKIIGPILPLFVSERDMLAFTAKEKAILEDYFNNLEQTPKQLATRHLVSWQSVIALLNSPAFRILYSKVFDKILPIESLIAIRQAMKHGDSKVTLEVARHYKLIENQQLDINSAVKQIDDPEAIKLLKKLGDELSVPKENESK